MRRMRAAYAAGLLLLAASKWTAPRGSSWKVRGVPPGFQKAGSARSDVEFDPDLGEREANALLRGREAVVVVLFVSEWCPRCVEVTAAYMAAFDMLRRRYDAEKRFSETDDHRKGIDDGPDLVPPLVMTSIRGDRDHGDDDQSSGGAAGLGGVPLKKGTAAALSHSSSLASRLDIRTFPTIVLLPSAALETSVTYEGTFFPQAIAEWISSSLKRTPTVTKSAEHLLRLFESHSKMLLLVLPPQNSAPTANSAATPETSKSRDQAESRSVHDAVKAFSSSFHCSGLPRAQVPLGSVPGITEATPGIWTYREAFGYRRTLTHVASISELTDDVEGVMMRACSGLAFEKVSPWSVRTLALARNSGFSNIAVLAMEAEASKLARCVVETRRALQVPAAPELDNAEVLEDRITHALRIRQKMVDETVGGPRLTQADLFDRTASELFEDAVAAEATHGEFADLPVLIVSTTSGKFRGSGVVVPTGMSDWLANVGELAAESGSCGAAVLRLDGRAATVGYGERCDGDGSLGTDGEGTTASPSAASGSDATREFYGTRCGGEARQEPSAFVFDKRAREEGKWVAEDVRRISATSSSSSAGRRRRDSAAAVQLSAPGVQDRVFEVARKSPSSSQATVGGDDSIENAPPCGSSSSVGIAGHRASKVVRARTVMEAVRLAHVEWRPHNRVRKSLGRGPFHHGKLAESGGSRDFEIQKGGGNLLDKALAVCRRGEVYYVSRRAETCTLLSLSSDTHAASAAGSPVGTGSVAGSSEVALWGDESLLYSFVRQRVCIERKPLVLLFTAGWCGHCKKAVQVLHRMAAQWTEAADATPRATSNQSVDGKMSFAVFELPAIFTSLSGGGGDLSSQSADGDLSDLSFGDEFAIRHLSSVPAAVWVAGEDERICQHGKWVEEREARARGGEWLRSRRICWGVTRDSDLAQCVSESMRVHQLSNSGNKEDDR